MAEELKRGYTFFYNNTTWKVTKTYIIKWDDGTKTNEYQVKSRQGIVQYLEIEIAKGKKDTYSFWSIEPKHSFLQKTQGLTKDFVSIGKVKFPKNISYQGVDYEFDERNDGKCKYDFETERVNCLEYTNADDTKFLALEFWDDEIEVSTGIPIKKSDISQIKPGVGILETPILDFIWKYIQYIIFGLFFLVMFLVTQCSNRNSWNNDSQSLNDSTKVNRSNGYYRSRNSGGFGK